MKRSKVIVVSEIVDGNTTVSKVYGGPRRNEMATKLFVRYLKSHDPALTDDEINDYINRNYDDYNGYEVIMNDAELILS